MIVEYKNVISSEINTLLTIFLLSVAVIKENKDINIMRNINTTNSLFGVVLFNINLINVRKELNIKHLVYTILSISYYYDINSKQNHQSLILHKEKSCD